jgi:predicted nucleic acid-binding protein
MASTVYLETSIVSYLAARPSKNLVTAARQQLTVQWWDRHRSGFQLFVSEEVVREVRMGDAEAVARRMALLSGLSVLGITSDAVELARALIDERCMPRDAATDALHVAIATANGVEYVLTWNCRHIANAQMRSQIERVIRLRGHQPPILCTPEELLGD